MDFNEYLKMNEQVLEKEKNAEDLYKAGFLNFVKVGSLDEVYYIRGECRAQMRKRTVYTFTIVANEVGNVRECECECPAGVGPNASCKHILAGFYALDSFSTSKSLITAETTTQLLQSFHRPRHTYFGKYPPFV